MTVKAGERLYYSMYTLHVYRCSRVEIWIYTKAAAHVAVDLQCWFTVKHVKNKEYA